MRARSPRPAAAAPPPFDAERDSERVRRHLGDLVEDSDLPHATIERAGGLSRGYLSQILHDRIELKLWHVLAVLRGVGVAPERFFAAAYPRRRRRPSSSAGVAARGPLLASPDADLELTRDRLALLVFGIAELEGLDRRLRACERALCEVVQSPAVGRRLEGTEILNRA